MAINVSLTPFFEKFIDDKVKSGRYNSASELVREALRVFVEHVHIQELRRQQLESKIDEGLASLDAGKGIPAEQVRADLNKEREKYRRDKKAKAA
jgi:antitoxin ParD1/3/4